MCSGQYYWKDQHNSSFCDACKANKPCPWDAFVFPNEAMEIKKHVFFAGIPWDKIHTTKAPFIPNVKTAEDAKYFEVEAKLMGVDGSPGDVVKAASDPGANQVWLDPQDVLDRIHKAPVDAQAPEATRARARNKWDEERPRDKLLRDPEFAEEVMVIRKSYAFLGYSYRRPKTWNIGDQTYLEDFQSLSKSEPKFNSYITEMR